MPGRRKKRKKSTKKKKKDPNAPKKPPSAYLLFSSDHRSAIKEAHPGAGPAEVFKLLGQNWKLAPAHVREKYEQQAAALKAPAARSAPVRPAQATNAPYTGRMGTDQLKWYQDQNALTRLEIDRVAASRREDLAKQHVLRDADAEDDLPLAKRFKPNDAVRRELVAMAREVAEGGGDSDDGAATDDAPLYSLILSVTVDGCTPRKLKISALDVTSLHNTLAELCDFTTSNTSLSFFDADFHEWMLLDDLSLLGPPAAPILARLRVTTRAPSTETVNLSEQHVG